jgi:Ca-activated chloride channel family protein
MSRIPHSLFALAAVAVLCLASVVVLAREQQPQPPSSSQQSPPEAPGRFRSGVELINVTATVSDRNGRFVSNLRKEDFVVYEDDQLVEVTNFSADRVPVSLGIALDTSGSMAGTKIREARSALDRLVYELLDGQDELFIYLFSNFPTLIQGWTTDRRLIARALGDIRPNGGTAMYDAVLDALPLAAQGQKQKKALVVISDGNDTTSRTDIREVKRQIRANEVLVYAIGIDGDESTIRRPPPPPRVPFPVPMPFPPGGRGRFPLRLLPQIGGQQGGWSWRSDDRVNVAALRDITDDSGGRTEIVRDPRDLDGATAAIADELSKQYYLGYPSPDKKDGRWHSIRVEVRNAPYRVRARKGYMAS